MTGHTRLLAPLLLLVAAALVVAVVLAPGFRHASTLSGYIEGEPLYYAAPVAGTVKALFFDRGAEAPAGATLFEVDPEQPRSQRDQALADLRAAQAQAQDARKGQRPVELAVLNANIANAEAQARNANVALARTQELLRAGVNSQAQLDAARAAAGSANAEVAAARRQRDAAALGSRADEIRAADARVAQAKAALAGAQAKLSDVAPKALSAARVEDVFFHPGEWVAANQPILSLLPNDRVRLRFFVPERSFAAYGVGKAVRFSCDGCRKGLTARITFISPRAEFTPPVIYSRESRDRLVYMVEALPTVRLNPGQPVDVEPLEPAS